MQYASKEMSKRGIGQNIDIVCIVINLFLFLLSGYVVLTADC